jgi:hypothetical protein
MGTRVEADTPMEIDIGGLRQLLLDDFHRCLEKSLAKTLGLFHSYTQRQQGLTYYGRKMRFLVNRSHPLWK